MDIKQLDQALPSQLSVQWLADNRPAIAQLARTNSDEVQALFYDVLFDPLSTNDLATVAGILDAVPPHCQREQFVLVVLEHCSEYPEKDVSSVVGAATRVFQALPFQTQALLLDTLGMSYAPAMAKQVARWVTSMDWSQCKDVDTLSTNPDGVTFPTTILHCARYNRDEVLSALATSCPASVASAIVFTLRFQVQVPSLRPMTDQDALHEKLFALLDPELLPVVQETYEEYNAHNPTRRVPLPAPLLAHVLEQETAQAGAPRSAKRM